MESIDAEPESARPTKRRRTGIGSDFAALVILAVFSLFTGGLVNVLQTKPLPWLYQSRADTMATAVAQVADMPAAPDAEDDQGELPHEISLEEFQSFVAEHKGLVLDARPAVFYHEAHIPGALSLPREAFAEDYPRLRQTLEAYKRRPVAVYCSGADCPDSQLVTDALTKLGYRKLLIYTSGWEEWSQTGLPQEGILPQS